MKTQDLKTGATWGLRAVLVIVGLIIVFLGADVGFGGLRTLGWQGVKPYFTVTQDPVYQVQDSHMRFFGGLFVAMGVFVVWAAGHLRQHQSGLKLVFVVVFFGGLARFSQLRPDVVFGPQVVGALGAELLLMPVLYFWLNWVLNTPESTLQSQRIQTGP